MPDGDEFDLFVSYSRQDNAAGWITAFIEALQAERRMVSGGRDFKLFFDKQDIRSLDDFRLRILDSLAASRLFVAFISPEYLVSEWCRREWQTWIDVEIAKHVFSDGAAIIYIVEVPWLAREMGREEVAGIVARLSRQVTDGLNAEVVTATLAVSRDITRRQLTQVRLFYSEGIQALQREDLRRTLAGLSRDLEDRASLVASAAMSRSTIPPYNRRFVGRHDELLTLRERLFLGRTGVISGPVDENQTGIASVHGLGGIGKTELAFTYAHAFAALYHGGRYLIQCEGISDIRLACLQLDPLFPDATTDEQRKSLELHFSAIREALRRHTERYGRILLILDNISDPLLLSPMQTDQLRVLGSQLHLLATTRLGAPAGQSTSDEIHWMTLAELTIGDSLRLLEKHRPYDRPELDAARQIARRLGGFALCVEVVGAYLCQHPEESYGDFLQRMGLDELEQIDSVAERREVVLRRRNNDKRLSTILSITLGKLTHDERIALDFAALLPADFVVLTWLRNLAVDLVDLWGGTSASSTAPPLNEQWAKEHWATIEQKLFALALLIRNANNGDDKRIVRCHRLVQDYLKARMGDRATKQRAIRSLVQVRDIELKRVTIWEPARWELVPMTRLAELWDEIDEPYSSWLANQVALKLDTVAAWPEAELLMRRALACDERRFGDNHPSVVLRLNNLSRVLIATDRFEEAEQSLRRALAIDRANPRHELTNIARTLTNLAVLLTQTNRTSEAENLLQEAQMQDVSGLGALTSRFRKWLNGVTRRRK
jgi:tetratricopeptide (TPR) repeat protein